MSYVMHPVERHVIVSLSAGTTKMLQGEKSLQVDNVMFSMRDGQGSSSHDSSGSGSGLAPGARGIAEAYEHNALASSRPRVSDSRPMAEGSESVHEGTSFTGSSANLAPAPRGELSACTKQQHGLQEATAGGSGGLILSHSMLAAADSVNFSCPAVIAASDAGDGFTSGLISQQLPVQEQVSEREAALSTAVIAYAASGAAVEHASAPAGGDRHTQTVSPRALTSVTPTSANRAPNLGPTHAAVQPLQLSRLSPSRMQGNILDVSRFEDAVSSSAFTAAATDSPTNSADQLYFADNEAQTASPTPSSSVFTAPRSYLNSPVQQLHAVQSGPVLPLAEMDHSSQRALSQHSLGATSWEGLHRSAPHDLCSGDITVRCSMSPQQPTRSGSGTQEPQPHCDIFPAVASQAFRRTPPQQVLRSAPLVLSHKHICAMRRM